MDAWHAPHLLHGTLAKVMCAASDRRCPAPNCHRFPLHLLSDGTIQCGWCKAITAHMSSDMPSNVGPTTL